MSSKRCGKCRQELPLDAFNRAGKGRQHWCRECFRAYFRERGAVHLAQVKQGVAQRRRKARQFVVDHLRDHPCVDCGERDLVVLEFDHLRDKVDHLSRLVTGGASEEKLLREMEKCEVVCVNCHRRRTARRRGTLRHRLDEERLARLRPPVARNIRHVLQILALARCEDCGENDSVVLDFDHNGPKRGSVIVLAFGGWGLKTLKTEIAECEIRCANCHRKRTIAAGGSYRLTA